MDFSKLIIILLSFAFINASHFGYSKEEQNNWHKEYPMCGGNSQSPIEIASCNVKAISMPMLKMRNYDKLLPGKLTIKNNGHTVSISLNQVSQKCYCKKDRPYIFGGSLQWDVFELDAFHFHWGLKDDRGCEHIVDNKKYPLEMHLVHRNIKYEDIDTAIKFKDGISVVAVFFDLSDVHFPALDSVIDHFQFVKIANSNKTIIGGITLGSLLPADTNSFYTYQGSLTTPACNEVVTWIIFTKPVCISYKQMKSFRILLDEKQNILADNFRFPQPIKNRIVHKRDTSETSVLSQIFNCICNKIM